MQTPQPLGHASSGTQICNGSSGVGGCADRAGLHTSIQPGENFLLQLQLFGTASMMRSACERPQPAQSGISLSAIPTWLLRLCEDLAEQIPRRVDRHPRSVRLNVASVTRISWCDQAARLSPSMRGADDVDT